MSVCFGVTSNVLYISIDGQGHGASLFLARVHLHIYK